MSDISEEQYELIRPYLPVQRGNVRISNLTLINAVLYITENGCKWRTLPPRFGPWHTVYTRLRRWAEAGVLDRLFAALQEHRLIRIKIEVLASTAQVSRCIPMVREHPKKGGSSHRKIPRRMEHQNSSGCRE